MAKFVTVLPDDVIKEFQKIANSTDQIFGEMTKAGAEAAADNIRANVPLQEMAGMVRITRTYKTPSDGGINTKVYISGYLPFKGKRTAFIRRGKSGGKVYSTSKGVPADFIAILYEYGRSTAPFPKRPFLRKSFAKGRIEKAMLEAQKKASGGLLE